MFSQLLYKLSRQSRNRQIHSRGSRRDKQNRIRLSIEPLERRELLSTVAWSSGPSLPAPRSDAAVLVAPDDALIVLGGNTTGDPRHVPKLSSTASFWSSAPTLEFERTGHGGVSLGGAGTLVYGGYDGDEASDEILNYDFLFGDSQDGAKLSIARAEFGAATDALDRAYAIGGLDKEGTAVLSSAERYDAAADQWTPIANLPAVRHSVAAVSDGAGHMYVFGGSSTASAGAIESTSFRYTVATGIWEAVAPMPVATEDSAAVYAENGSIYVIGGVSASGTVATVQTYDPVTDTWTADVDLPVAVHSHAAAIDSLGRIVVVGGTDVTGSDIASVYRSQRLDIPDSVPVFFSTPNENGLQGADYTYDVDTFANPVATFSLSIAPAGMAIDSVTGVISWQPNAGQLGDHPVTVTAINQAGIADQNYVVNVLTGTVPEFTSSPNLNGSIDSFYTYDANATAFPNPTFDLSVAPTGMTIDALTGLISWQPEFGQIGDQSVTITASNRAGSGDQSFVVHVLGDITPPTAPTNVTFVGAGTTSVDLSWTAATDNREVDHYEVLQGRRCGWRGRNTCYGVIQSDIPSTTTTVVGLEELRSFKLIVRAVDAAGNRSGNSNQVIATTQGAPILRYYKNGIINGPVSATANFSFDLQLTASANPAPTFSLVSGPATMTVDPVTGALQWTPTASDTGLVTATVSATNSVGSTQLDIPVTVAADVPVLSFQFNPNSGGDRYGFAETLFEIQVSDLSNTPSMFELLDAPTGMTIDPMTGLIEWTPTVADAGQKTVIVRATNSAGSTDRTIAFETFFTGRVSNIQVTNLEQLEPTISWSAPTGTGISEITGYSIDLTARYRRGRSRRTERIHFDSPGTGTSLDLAGLTIGRNYQVVINAYDAAGNRGLFSTELVEFASRPALPSVGWTVRDASGGTAIIANQPVVVQLTDNNPDPSTIAIVNAPAGLTLDSNTGMATWTPSAADVGAFTATFRFTNSIGSRDVVVPINVRFSGAVTGAFALRNGNTASVSWTAPVDNVEPIVEYQITMHWRWSGRRRSRTIVVSGTTTSLDLALIPTGAVSHRGVSITPISESGLYGISSELIPYIS
jgi:hypothetical protein